MSRNDRLRNIKLVNSDVIEEATRKQNGMVL